jgi:predicted transcriptional regulator
VGFAYYLENYNGVSEFTPADVNNCYYEAKMEASNTSQMIIQNIKRGFVMEAKKGEKAGRRYTLTASGEHFVRQKLDVVSE